MKSRINRSLARGTRSGVALVYAVFGTVVVASMASVMFTMAGVSDRQADVRKGSTRARYLAEGALRVVVKELQAELANWNDPPADGVRVVAGVPVEFTIQEIGEQVQYVDPSGVLNLVQPFEVETSVTIDGVHERAHRLVNANWTPLFQFAVFYNSDLEIHAGPDMTLRGRVHSNRDMYLGGGSTITLDTNYVRAVGGIYRQSKNTGNAAGGNVDIRKWVANPFDPSEPSDFVRMKSRGQLIQPSTSGYDSAFMGLDINGDGFYDGLGELEPFALGAIDRWGIPTDYTGGTGQTVMTSDHGAREAVTPAIESIRMYEEVESGDYVFNESTGAYDYVGDGNGTHGPGYYYENSGLSIIVADDGTFTVHDGEGNDVTSAVQSAVTMTSVPDMRQSNSGSDHVETVQIDMELLAQTDYFPDNGLLFAAHEVMGEGTEVGGVMLTNGSEIADALTVVSPGAVYVQGDYNTVDKKGAAVIGDAVNLLSNDWDGTKTPGTLPHASETTFNFAMVTGAYETEPGRYSGGLENLPRFHENWSGVPCNISGSFVKLYNSEFATGDWRYGSDRYTAPIRAWQYDPAFNSLSALPPFTPMAVSAEQVVSW